MSQNEIARPYDMGLGDDEIGGFWSSELSPNWCRWARAPKCAPAIADYMVKHQGAMFIGDPGLDDTMSMIRDQFFRFAQEKVTPFAHQWHLKDELIPIEVVNELSELGVFGLTIPESYGGAGLSKLAMCVVSEELSRGYIGVGSLATRSEIAAELILCGGTKEQREHWLPLIASGEKLPTAVFTEPSGGSDVAALKTRAVKDGDVYKIYGNKTWITHAARADMMTLLVRTNPGSPRLSRSFDVPRRKAARHGEGDLSRQGHERRRDRRARLSRHEGIRNRLRRLRSAGRQSARPRRRPGLQAIDADLRSRAHPDGGARRRRRALRHGSRAALCARAPAVRPAR